MGVKQAGYFSHLSPHLCGFWIKLFDTFWFSLSTCLDMNLTVKWTNIYCVFFLVEEARPSIIQGCFNITGLESILPNSFDASIRIVTPDSCISHCGERKFSSLHIDEVSMLIHLLLSLTSLQYADLCASWRTTAVMHECIFSSFSQVQVTTHSLFSTGCGHLSLLLASTQCIVDTLLFCEHIFGKSKCVLSRI